MAKSKTKEPKVAKAAKEAAPEHKYGVADLAKILNIKDASVRVQLRNAGIEKDGKSYGWDTKAELDEIADQLKAPKVKAAKEEKPARKKAA